MRKVTRSMKQKSKSRYVQAKNPITDQWTRIDTFLGKIVGKRRKKYACPIAQKKKE